MNQSNIFKVLRYRLWQLYAAPGYALKNTLTLWRFRNRNVFKAFGKYTPRLSDAHRDIVRHLENDGIAIAHINDFFPEDTGVFSRLIQTTNDGIAAGAKRTNMKEFLLYFFRSDKEPVDFLHPFVRLALHAPFLEIISSYFKTFAHFEYATGNIAIPTRKAHHPQASQRWHRDPGVYKNCKIFVYLTDVDEQSGPFIYVAGSQPGGPLSHAAPHRFFGVGSYYPKDAVVNNAFDDKKVLQHVMPCHGKAGTVIFANTMGLHRGGYALERERRMLTFYYRPVPRGESLLHRFLNPPDIRALPPIVAEALSPQSSRNTDTSDAKPMA